MILTKMTVAEDWRWPGHRRGVDAATPCGGRQGAAK